MVTILQNTFQGFGDLGDHQNLLNELKLGRGKYKTKAVFLSFLHIACSIVFFSTSLFISLEVDVYAICSMAFLLCCNPSQMCVAPLSLNSPNSLHTVYIHTGISCRFLTNMHILCSFLSLFVSGQCFSVITTKCMSV